MAGQPRALPSPPAGVLHLAEDVPTAFAAVVAAELSTGSVGPSGRSTRSLALSGGGTARQCYERLAAIDEVAWGQLELLTGDERCVPPDSPDANQRLIREALGKRMEQVAAFWPMNCDDPEGYGAIVRERQPLDVIHLGLGPDGHTASLFGGSAALDSPPGALVVRNEDPTGLNPYRRLTFTLEAIDRANLVVFTVSGASKREALAKVIAGEDLPAGRVRASRVIWLCDAEALGPLE